jgi:hypothetical protein
MHFLEQKALLRHEFFTPFTIGRVYLESFRYLLTHPLYLVGLYGCVWLWRTGRLTLGRSLWLGYFGLWTLVYLTAIFWPRFALPALFLATPLAAFVILRTLAGLTAGMAPRPLKWAAAGLLAGFFLWFYPVTGLEYMQTVTLDQTHAPSRLVEYLRACVPSRTLIETPEYELVFLDDEHRIHLMPAFFIIESGEKGVELLNPRRYPYNFNQIKADVLILGYFGKTIFAQIYSPAQVAKYWRKVAQIDCYDIYVRRSSPLLKADQLLRISPECRLPILRTTANAVHDSLSLYSSFSH